MCVCGEGKSGCAVIRVGNLYQGRISNGEIFAEKWSFLDIFIHGGWLRVLCVRSSSYVSLAKYEWNFRNNNNNIQLEMSLR